MLLHPSLKAKHGWKHLNKTLGRLSCVFFKLSRVMSFVGNASYYDRVRGYMSVTWTSCVGVAKNSQSSSEYIYIAWATNNTHSETAIKLFGISIEKPVVFLLRFKGRLTHTLLRHGKNSTLVFQRQNARKLSLQAFIFVFFFHKTKQTNVVQACKLPEASHQKNFTGKVENKTPGGPPCAQNVWRKKLHPIT